MERTKVPRCPTARAALRAPDRTSVVVALAEDKPLHKDTTSSTAEKLREPKIDWLLRHDQQTGGIMGLMPLVKGMPLRITATQQRLQ